ncbi:MAG: leucyl aminopeptidase [Candidatus Eremiobacteraeota bacterium]|nr:leucyl aminopeptidase [Candidatus Eremiobacteraeota bacterium]
MEIITIKTKPQDIEADAVVMFTFSDVKPAGELKSLDEKMNGMISRLIESGEISGKYREFTLIHTTDIKAPRLLIMGLGKNKDFDVDKIRSMTGRSARILRRIKCKNIAYSSFTGLGIDPRMSAQYIAEGLIMGLYHFKRHVTKTSPKEPIEKVTIIAKNSEEVELVKSGIEKGMVLARATNFARDLVNEPGNIMTPTYFEKQARKISKELGIEIKVYEEDELREMGVGAFLAVAQGSKEPPKIVKMTYEGDPGKPFVGFVGKGITFDAGGLCIKPAEGMYRMYSDCSGACAVLGAMSAIAKLKLPVNVVGIMPMTENMPSGTAYRPGDIITSYSGKTIEILNTDAEGRLALADGITMAKEAGAKFIVDIATLTGGCVIALGCIASGIMGNNEKLIDYVKQAGEIAAENMWHLPLYDDYFAQIYSDVADMENLGGKSASACTAGIFLKQFVEDETPWVHIDIAGTAMIERERTPYLKKPYLPKEGGTGVGVRTLVHLAEIMIKKYDGFEISDKKE